MSTLYGDALYSEELYFSTDFIGTWKRSFSFDYLSGTTVLVTPTMSLSSPVGTSIELYAGEDQDNLERIHPNVKQAVLFQGDTSGATNIYFEICLKTTDPSITPTVSSLSILLEQETSLYTVAKQVLVDALTPSGTSSFIDPWLQNVLIPFSWLPRQSHRESLAQIGEACGGVTFSDRNGVIRIESGLYENGGVIVDTIGEDRIIDTSSPVSTVINRVDVTTSPYVALAEQDVWNLEGGQLVDIGTEYEFQVFFSDYRAVFDAFAQVTGGTIVTEKFFTWGGDVKILATDTELNLTVRGQPLVVRGARTVSRFDGASIRKNSERQLSIENNVLIQDVTTAGIVAQAIVDVAGNERRDIEITWRGDPTLELGDRVVVMGETGTITEQQFRYNGALQSQSKIVRI